MKLTNQTIKEVLFEMGFKGLLLKKLECIVVDNDTLHALYSFILETEEERMTKMLLVHKFVKQMQERASYASCEEFVFAYEAAETEHEKGEIVEKLMTVSFKPSILTKVLAVLDDDTNNLSCLYAQMVKYRKMQYKPEEFLQLLESLPM
ncbi:hypothetical protein [Paenibacillus agilis]|uniref:Uncharacterized protein n=1 Tax=Paenibacillus agilis TaxID=3020863 RepID=A0A559IEE4_9BACL|nr:hypothetical protein [Paenibacillus agilis]TVX86029.1 hypothetical protein FPZ44_24090 [Paenibacillus agilis]